MHNFSLEETETETDFMIVIGIETGMRTEREIEETEETGTGKGSEIEIEGDPFTIHRTAPLMTMLILIATEILKDYACQEVILSQQYPLYLEQYFTGKIKKVYPQEKQDVHKKKTISKKYLSGIV